MGVFSPPPLIFLALQEDLHLVNIIFITFLLVLILTIILLSRNHFPECPDHSLTLAPKWLFPLILANPILATQSTEKIRTVVKHRSPLKPQLPHCGLAVEQFQMPSPQPHHSCRGKVQPRERISSVCTVQKHCSLPECLSSRVQGLVDQPKAAPQQHSPAAPPSSALLLDVPWASNTTIQNTTLEAASKTHPAATHLEQTHCVCLRKTKVEQVGPAKSTDRL